MNPSPSGLSGSVSFFLIGGNFILRLMLQYSKDKSSASGVAIIGIGGGGANVLKCFNGSSAENIRLCIMSLDERLSQACGNVEFIQLGEGVSHGLGSGGDPEVGEQAMQESEQKVRGALTGCRLVVMVVGLGGGTGSGAGPVLARLAKETGVFLVSVVMMPFSFEGKRRREQAMEALEQVSRVSDIVLCFENDYMEELFRDRSGAREVFEEVNRLLAKATAAVPMMATSPGLINLGLDELAAALENSDSRCIFGSGSGYGSDRAKQAATAAVESPLMRYHGALRFARTAIVHIAGGDTLSISEIRQAMEVIQRALGSEEVRIFFGTAVKANLGEEVKVTLIASIDAEAFKVACAVAPVPERPADDTAEQLTPTAPEEEVEQVVPSDDGKDEPSYDDKEATDGAALGASESTGHPGGDPVPAEEDTGDKDTLPVDANTTSTAPSATTLGGEEQLYDDTTTYPDSTQSNRQGVPLGQSTPPSKRQLNLFHDPSTPVYNGQGGRDTVPPVAKAKVHVQNPLPQQETMTPTSRGRSNGTDVYVDSRGGRRNAPAQDDLDIPPSMRNSDSRGIFSDR